MSYYDPGSDFYERYDLPKPIAGDFLIKNSVAEASVKNATESLRKALVAANKELAECRVAAHYYLRMQRHIIADENIRDAWNDFMTFYILAYPDIRELK